MLIISNLDRMWYSWRFTSMVFLSKTSNFNPIWRKHQKNPNLRLSIHQNKESNEKLPQLRRAEVMTAKCSLASWKPSWNSKRTVEKNLRKLKNMLTWIKIYHYFIIGSLISTLLMSDINKRGKCVWRTCDFTAHHNFSVLK